MSVRTGVFIKYIVQFFADSETAGSGGGLASAVVSTFTGGGGALPLKVSNDVLAGDFCIDADISVKMHRWAAGTDFKIMLYDLPEPKVELLEKAVGGESAAPKVKISLGYFDNFSKFDSASTLVLEGVYNDVSRSSEGDRLMTTIKGVESALYACGQTRYSTTIGKSVSFGDALAALFAKENTALPRNLIGASAVVTNNLPTTTLNAPTFRGPLLTSIDALAKQADGEFFISDKQVFFGAPIANDAVAAAEFDYAVNLAKFEPLTKKLLNPDKKDAPSGDSSSEDEDQGPDEAEPLKAQGFSFIVTGDPTLRPGQKVVVKKIKGFSSPEFRIRHVEHNFSSSAGYSCSGAATEALRSGALARKIDHALDPNAASALRGLDDRVQSRSQDKPPIEVAGVKTADDGYLASLYYGQTPAPAETQPSVNTSVNQKDAQVFPKCPIMSPFAWSNCGLVTPVYPGMKAVLLHNRASPSDALVAGYIWSNTPSAPPPKSHLGDWWLSLPIDFDASQPPSNSTKGVNDITANNGCRVIELKGFKITVGAKALNSVGSRPTTDDSALPETCTIAHASGAVITVKDSEIDIDTGKGPKLTMSGSGLTMTDGTLNVKLANGKLAIG